MDEKRVWRDYYGGELSLAPQETLIWVWEGEGPPRLGVRNYGSSVCIWVEEPGRGSFPGAGAKWALAEVVAAPPTPLPRWEVTYVTGQECVMVVSAATQEEAERITTSPHQWGESVGPGRSGMFRVVQETKRLE